MIPVVDLSNSDSLRETLAKHPLYLRRAEVEQQFLDELTHLTRKYGLELKAETRTEYGETYPDHVLTVPYEGTEARYVEGTFGIEFDAAPKGGLLPCTPEERVQYEEAKAARAEEDEVINDFSARTSDAYYAALDIGMNDMMKRMAAQHRGKKTTPECSCGEKFKTEGALKAHAKKTGHRS